MPQEIDKRQHLLPMDARAPVWRPIHYLGSKLRLAESIREMIDRVDPSGGAVCDLFAGSGTVSLALSQTRSVVAADIQEYSRVLCKAVLNPASLEAKDVADFLRHASTLRADLESCLEPVLAFEERAIEHSNASPELLCDVSENGSLIVGKPESRELAKCLEEVRRRINSCNAAASLVTTRYFGGSYFAYRQTLDLDCHLAAIRSSRETYLAAILSTASFIVNSVGKQFAQPMRPRRKDGTIKSHLISQMCRDRSHDVTKILTGWIDTYRSLRQGHKHRVVRGDYREVLKSLEGISIIYADPPYTRDHYSRFYHVLETMCLGDSPDVSTTSLSGEGASSRGLYRTDRHQSPFCIKSQAPKAFLELFEGARQLPLLLSYSPFVKDGHPRMMTIEAIALLARKFYSHVEVVQAGQMTHSKLNKTDLHRDAPEDAEVFLVCQS